MPDKRCLGIVAGAVVLTVCLGIALIVDSIHVIDEGEVGVYYVYGDLEETLGYPGKEMALSSNLVLTCKKKVINKK